jgi:FkbM family methyltransferase
MAVDELRIGEFVLRVPSEDASASREAAKGRWEPETLSILSTVVADGDVVIDVGAYVRGFTAVAASREARGHAFEPDPVARRALERMLGLNPELAARVIVHPEALGSSDRVARLSSEQLGNSMASLVRDQSDEADVQVRDAATALSECGLADCSLVKADVEGTEYEIFPRILPELRQFRPTVLLSVHTYHLREPFAHLPLPVRVFRWRLRAIPLHAKLIIAARSLGPTYVAGRNRGRWHRLRRLRLLSEFVNLRGKELVVRGLRGGAGPAESRRSRTSTRRAG